MKIQNTFQRATIQKDLDGRFVDNGQLLDSENFLVTTSEGDGSGVGKNVLGNVKRTTLVHERDYDFTGAMTIGVGKNESKNKIYNFIKSDAYDCITEYDTETKVMEFVYVSSAGGALNFQSAERITNVDVIMNGESGAELLAWSGDSNPPRIMNIAWAKTFELDDLSEDEISVMKPSPIFSPTIETTLIPLEADNFLEDRFVRFAYRYKYRDGYYSAPSSWSDVAFTPKAFELDYQTYENKGMLNLANAVNVTFNYGPREVSEVELLFKESQKNTIYVSQNFIKNTDGSDDDTLHTFQVSRSKIFKVLTSEQLTRNFDNVPLTAVAQTTIAGRLAYANYLEGRDIDTVIDFTAECESTSPFTGNTISLTADDVLVTTQPNVVDFQRKVVAGGTFPVDYMDFTTNTAIVPIDPFDTVDFDITITPEPGYATTLYTITVKDGATVLHNYAGLTGTQTRSFTVPNSTPPLIDTKNIKVYVTSLSGFLYACETDLKYLENGTTLLSFYKYFSDYQYSFPKTGGYSSSLEGDVVKTGEAVIDFTGYEFLKGKQLRINFDMVSTLTDMPQPPSVTFFYNIMSSYDDLDDFMTNSSFKPQLEEVFSDLFVNGTDGNGGFVSMAGSLVSYVGFKTSYAGEALTIKNPNVTYSVNEPSGVTVNKIEFFINTDISCESLTSSSYASQHSNRDYEVCMIYLDNKGRKTTALIDKDNTYHVPAENSVLINKPKVTVNHAPPSWAKYYKFGIKTTKTSYETIYGNVIYKEGIYRWIQLVGENKNKVSEGDLLTVKTDFRGPLITVEKVKVLEIATKDKDFIKDNTIGDTTKPLIEEPGLYMKIKQGDFDMNIDEDSFKNYHGYLKRRYASESWVTTDPMFGEYDESLVWVPDALRAGSQINFSVIMKAYGSIAFEHRFERLYTVTKDYDSVYDWFQDVVATDDAWQTYLEHPQYMTFPNPIQWEFQGADNNRFAIKPWRNGTASRDIITDVDFTINFAGGNIVFETEPFEDLSAPFYETPEVFTITDGAHEFTEHILEGAANCFAYGNGVESWKVQDAFTGKTFGLDANPTEVNKEGYKQIHRFADITYSEPYNSNSNMNRLNEFNLSLANFKDDMEKSYGPIYKIKGMDDNLQVFQQDKDSQVMYGSDVLFNADGSSNLSKISNVLGGQITYAGDYGISSHPDSFDVYGFDTYHTDVKRGVVIKKSNNGLFEVSVQGMRSYFKKLFSKNSLIRVNGKYDSYNDFYVLNIKYRDEVDAERFVTWIYSDKDNGWLGRLNFDPEDMVNVNGKFFAFKGGEVYEHNQDSAYNTFFGLESPSKATFNFSQNPSERKQYKTFEIEGTVPADITATTDMNSGYVNKQDFDKVENVYYAYVRTSNDTMDTSLLSTQGIGKIAGIVGDSLSFLFPVNDTVSVGDTILNADMEVVGTVIDKQLQILELDGVNNVAIGDYVLSAKPQSVENSHLLGYHCEVNMEFSSTQKQEIYAVNSEVAKSFY